MVIAGKSLKTARVKGEKMGLNVRKCKGKESQKEKMSDNGSLCS